MPEAFLQAKVRLVVEVELTVVANRWPTGMLCSAGVCGARHRLGCAGGAAMCGCPIPDGRVWGRCTRGRGDTPFVRTAGD